MPNKCTEIGFQSPVKCPVFPLGCPANCPVFFRSVLGELKGPVSKTAARPTDNECSSVGRTQLSDTGVGDELTVVGQVTRISS